MDSDLNEAGDEWVQTAAYSDDDDDDPYVFDTAKEPLKVFACRHAFHVRCLKKHCRYGSFSDIMTTKSDKLRCPVCNFKNFDIEVEKGGRRGMRQESPQKKVLSNMEFSVDPVERREQMRQARMTMRSQSIINKKLVTLSKKMDLFASLNESNGLSFKDFRIVKV